MNTCKRRTAPLLLALGRLALILALVLALPGIEPAQAAETYTVTLDTDDFSAHDSNPNDGICLDMLSRGCTLRAAIEQANANLGGDYILFNHAMTINLDTTQGALPALAEKTFIDASSVWNTTNDRPGVTINGSGLDDGALFLSADLNEIFGLYITNFEGTAIYIVSATNTIGGTGQGQRNVLSGNNNGIVLNGPNAQYNKVQNNFIGVTPDGLSEEGNSYGVVISSGASYNTLGGSSYTEGNVISSNTSSGVLIQDSNSQDNGLGGNIIGWGANQVQALGNKANGISINEAVGSYIGGGGAYEGNRIGNNVNGIAVTNVTGITNIEKNIIRSNQSDGIFIQESTSVSILTNQIASNGRAGITIVGAAATGNSLMQNQITGNVGKGIQLQNGANNGRSAPVVSNATSSSASGTVSGCANCYIEIFSDTGDEGWTYEGGTSAGSTGSWSFNGAIAGPNITATVTDSGGNSSEFSAPKALGGGSKRLLLPIARKR